jgi:16S rRNA (cytosine967-C5)-methyltransferase
MQDTQTRSRVSPARLVAFEVLRRVHDGAFASDLLLEQSKPLDSRDAGLAAEIVFGCLRYQAQLDRLITLWCATQLDIEVRIALRIGIYQLRYLDRIPRHAAVSESVELVKQSRKRSAAGLVNAVLRKINRNPVSWPDRATELSIPPWLLERWDRHFGAGTAEKIARAALTPPETYIASTGRIQDIGSQSIVPLLDLHPGMSFLDLCAAPGNKTAQALEYGVSAVACDLHWRRLRALADLPCRRVVLNGVAPLPFRTRFDRILVDAPCSGTGTLGRNPEIKWRLQPTDLPPLHRLQTSILRNALACLAPGGTLVYSTCSLEPEENQRVISQFSGNWTPTQRIPGADPGDGFFAAVLTSF